MEDKKLNSKEIKEWDSLDTPQIANSEEEKTIDERLAAVNESIDRIRHDVRLGSE
ncbi:hypothetical protein DFP93_11851 [Aneurinibacillus soli]|uniref:Uncharacterized protein n=1 Tax=Aneurinibacillus soli TaxID=1500254 RepID=A0A0U5ASC1_9BACL|nr:hypothetical protein [Aneurinibacillus soli]PYE59301.1 hypothetical protein DFP93_11851 [Aneurinibacillus soli]BAU26709.1 hypothetical protein CB4_00852 [Aneurinibacillus soli]